MGKQRGVFSINLDVGDEMLVLSCYIRTFSACRFPQGPANVEHPPTSAVLTLARGVKRLWTPFLNEFHVHDVPMGFCPCLELKQKHIGIPLAEPISVTFRSSDDSDFFNENLCHTHPKQTYSYNLLQPLTSQLNGLWSTLAPSWNRTKMIKHWQNTRWCLLCVVVDHEQ